MTAVPAIAPAAIGGADDLALELDRVSVTFETDHGPLTALKDVSLERALNPRKEGTVRAACLFLFALTSHLIKMGHGMSRRAKGQSHSIIAVSV